MKNIKLRNAIVESGERQYIIAVKTGIPLQTLNAYVGGWRKPRPARQKKLAEILGKKRDELFDDI